MVPKHSVIKTLHCISQLMKFRYLACICLNAFFIHIFMHAQLSSGARGVGVEKVNISANHDNSII